MVTMKMPAKRIVVTMIVGTLSLVSVLCMVTLAVCVLRGTEARAIEVLKDLGLVAMTALATSMSRLFDPEEAPVTPPAVPTIPRQ